MSASRKIRNARGELVDLAAVPATRFKNELAAMFERVALGEPVAITKHDRPKAVLISYEEFEALMRERLAGLDELEKQFDALLAGMQGPKARAAMAAAFDAEPTRLKRAAAKAVPKRPRRSRTG
jgi:prevent-host-death family protein